MGEPRWRRNTFLAVFIRCFGFSFSRLRLSRRGLGRHRLEFLEEFPRLGVVLDLQEERVQARFDLGPLRREPFLSILCHGSLALVEPGFVHGGFLV